MTAAERTRDLIASDPVCRSAGISVISLDDDAATLRMPVREDMSTSLGTAHAGWVMMLADTAAGAVALALGDAAITTGADVSFLAPARAGDVLTATARLRARSGRSLLIDVSVDASDAPAELPDEDGRAPEGVPRRIAEMRARALARTPALAT